MYEKYRPLLPFVRHRADLAYLIATVGGELAVGHSYTTALGDVPSEDPVSVGLLGADFAVENGRYRIKKIYTGENWNPELRAPLSAPGIQVAEGDYLLEVNGRALVPPQHLSGQGFRFSDRNAAHLSFGPAGVTHSAPSRKRNPVTSRRV